MFCDRSEFFVNSRSARKAARRAAGTEPVGGGLLQAQSPKPGLWISVIFAALLAAGILANGHPEIRDSLDRFRADQTERVLAAPDPSEA